VVANERVVALLDRQHTRAESKEGAEFFPELKRYWDLLDSEPALRGLVKEFRDEADQAERKFAEHDRQLQPQLIELKQELLDRAPEADDPPGLTRPTSPFAHRYEWTRSMANFDLLADGSSEAWKERSGFDDSASGLMVNILDERLRLVQYYGGPAPLRQQSEKNLRPDLDDLHRRLGNLARRHSHARQELEQAIASHGGFALQELAIYIEQMNPPVRDIQSDEDEEVWMNEQFKNAVSQLYVIREAVRHPINQHFDQTQRDALNYFVERARPALDRLHEHLRTRLLLAPEPAPSYPKRVLDWVTSPWGLLIVSTLSGAVVTGVLAGNTDGWELLLGGAVLAALLPPLAAGGVLPKATATKLNALFIMLAVALTAAVAATLGLGLAVVVLALLLTVFWLGQRSRGT
jgi:hypothetical protein